MEPDYMTKFDGWRASHEFKSELRQLEHDLRMEIERQTTRIFVITCIGGSALFILFTLLLKVARH